MPPDIERRTSDEALVHDFLVGGSSADGMEKDGVPERYLERSLWRRRAQRREEKKC